MLHVIVPLGFGVIDCSGPLAKGAAVARATMAADRVAVVLSVGRLFTASKARPR